MRSHKEVENMLNFDPVERKKSPSTSFVLTLTLADLRQLTDEMIDAMLDLDRRLYGCGCHFCP